MANKPSEPYRRLNSALVAAGVPSKASASAWGVPIQLDDAVDFIVNSRIDASPYADILIDHASELKDSREIEMVARCMMQRKGFRSAMPWLLSLFESYPHNSIDEHSLWAAGQAIYRINSRAHYDTVLRLCRRTDLGIAKIGLVGFLPRIKSDEAYELLLECLEDASVRGWAIEALGRFGRVEAIGGLELLTVEKGKYEYKAKQTALRRLKRKLDD